MSHLSVWVGPMFAGKTSTLLREAQFQLDLQPNKRILIINHSLDSRDSRGVSSHQGNFPGPQLPWCKSNLLSTVDITEVDLIVVDEAQFFPDLEIMVKQWLQLDKMIYVGGLNADVNQNFFGEIYRLLPLADRFTHLTAICSHCIKAYNGIITPEILKSMTAPFTARIEPEISDNQIDIGGAEKFRPSCRFHLKLKNLMSH